MQTIHLNIDDQNIFNTVMEFLNQLPQKKLQMDIDNVQKPKNTPQKLKAISLKTKNFSFDRQKSNKR